MISMLKTGGGKALVVLIAEFLSHVEKTFNAPTTRMQAGAPTTSLAAKQIRFFLRYLLFVTCVNHVYYISPNSLQVFRYKLRIIDN